MISGYSKHGLSRIALGTHMGSFSEEDSKKYIEAISYALQHGITSIDTAINYRGMCSEKDVGTAISKLIRTGKLNREDFLISSKAGLLFGDIREGLNPINYRKKILEPKGITEQDFCKYKGLYQTLSPDFFEVTLEQSLKNLSLNTIDIHYIHIPEITRAQSTTEEFYAKMRSLFEWYERKVNEKKVKAYGIALEFMIEEPENKNWWIDMERLSSIANEVSNGNSHFQYVQLPYNLLCPYATTYKYQSSEFGKISIVDLLRKLGITVVGSMPFARGDGFENYTKEELLTFALNGVDTVNIGSKNIEHIKEVIHYIIDK